MIARAAPQGLVPDRIRVVRSEHSTEVIGYVDVSECQLLVPRVVEDEQGNFIGGVRYCRTPGGAWLDVFESHVEPERLPKAGTPNWELLYRRLANRYGWPVPIAEVVRWYVDHPVEAPPRELAVEFESFNLTRRTPGELAQELQLTPEHSDFEPAIDGHRRAIADANLPVLPRAHSLGSRVIDYVVLSNTLRAAHAPTRAALVEYMAERHSASFEEIGETVHGDAETSAEAIRQNVARTNRDLRRIASCVTFITGGGAVHKRIASPGH